MRAFLACRSVELALKAYLSLKGKSLLELSTSHDLEMLLQTADEKQLSEFVVLEDAVRFQFKRAASYYRDKVFEYPALVLALKAYPDWPDIDLIITGAETLVAALQEPCSTHK